MRDGYLRSDEWQDAIESLRHLSECLEIANRRPLAWKWVILTAHNALQGSLMCVLAGTDGSGALSEASMREVFEWYEKDRRGEKVAFPKVHVADLKTLIKRAKDQSCMSAFGGMPVVIYPKAERDLQRLIDLRNQFTHYLPMGWSIELEDLPRIVGRAVHLCRELLVTHPAATLRLTEAQHQEVIAITGVLQERLLPR